MSTSIKPLVSAEDLKAHLMATSPRLSPLLGRQLEERARSIVDLPLTFPFTSIATLTPRQPFVAGRGLMDIYRPGRWDCTSNLVHIDAIVTQRPGMWDGSVAYCSFTAQSGGLHLVFVHFTGANITMRMDGPWGSNTAHTATTSDIGTVAATVTLGANQQVFFQLSCVDPSNLPALGYIKSIDFYA